MADIDKIKGSYDIYSNGEYVVLSGTKLYIFKTDGSIVSCRNDLRRTGRITFLSGNRLLLCSSKGVFHLIDLRDGSDVWTVPYIKTDFNLSDLAISPDEAYAYTYDQRNGKPLISRLNLQDPSWDMDICEIDMDVGVTADILCDEEGVCCVLKTYFETIGGKHYSQMGVRIHDFDGICPSSTRDWKTKWSLEGLRSALHFWGSTDRILTTDLQIYDPSSGIFLDLLENETVWQRPKVSLTKCWLDSSKQFLFLKYPVTNTIIDVSAQKVAAQYAVSYRRGCLIGDEYWLCIDNRILRKPFPMYEEAPPPPPVKIGGWGIDYSKHPELW